MNNPLKIYSGSNTLLYTTPVNTGCRRKVQLMSEDSITVKFSDKDRMVFPVGSRIEDYYATEEQQGKYNANTDGYDYELKFHAYYWRWANKLLFYQMAGVDDAPKETSFSLTASIEVHASIILRALNALGFTYNNSPFRVDTDSDVTNEAKYISYSNTSILGGIQAIAEEYECEWWVESNAIHFGKCHALGEYDFTVGDNVSAITPSDTSTKANRLYVYGSDRNLPSDYRATSGSDVVGTIVTRRLMLPAGTPYLQTASNIPEDQIIEGEVVFDSVYPRTQLTVSAVATYTSQATDGAEQTFYRITYGNSFPFLKEYILQDQELHIVFESGALNGMDFAVKFNPLGENEKFPDDTINDRSQMFEIVVNADYGRELPDLVLHPEAGDRFILYGWDPTKMEALDLIANAERELLAEGLKEVEERKKDLSTYTCPMMWDWCKEKGAANSMPQLGSTVTLHFSAGDTGRQSRVIGFEHDLDIEYANVTYTCGEKVSASRLKTLESKVEGLTHSGEKVKMQNSLDFLSKRYSDRTPYGLTIGGTLTAEDAAMAKTFVSGLMGWRIDQQGNAELESGVFRSFAQFAEIITNRLTAIEGDQLFTEGDTIEEATDNGNGTYTLKLHEKWDGYFTAQYEHNVLKGIYNNIIPGLTPEPGQQSENNAIYYTSWMNVLSVDAAANELVVTLYPDEETPAGKNFPPQSMMKIARWGNSGDSSDEECARRQTCMYISSTEGRIMKLFRVTKPIIDEGNIACSLGTVPEFLLAIDARLKADDDVVYAKTVISQSLIHVDYKGRPVPTTIDRGSWTGGEIYYDGTSPNESGAYERSKTWDKGHGWLANTGMTATEDNRPSWNTAYWTHIEGDPHLHLEFNEIDSLVDADDPECPLSVTATYMGDDVTDSEGIYYDWTRKSERDGIEDTASDTIWNTAHKNGGSSRTLDGSDMNFQFGIPPDKLSFTVTAVLNDSSNPNLTQIAQVQLEMI